MTGNSNSGRTDSALGCYLGVIAALVIGAYLIVVIPGFFRVTCGGPELEVKQNLHAIQLAIERYSVDSAGGTYPPFLMGGDWTDSYTTSLDWAKQNGLVPADIVKYLDTQDTWIESPANMGDVLIMEMYMPVYPQNPFRRTKKQGKLKKIAHLGMTVDGNPLLERIVGGKDGNCMYEVFGPIRLAAGQIIQGDYFVHHIFNNPPYDTLTDVRKEIGVDWNNPSGNELLVGNFSYTPRYEKYTDGIPEPGTAQSRQILGCTLAGYGGMRTPGQDVYNRNGNYKGRFRTEHCETDCDPVKQLFSDDIPCICGQQGITANPLANDGGSDTLPDGVIITLDSGIEKKSSRVNFQVTE